MQKAVAAPAAIALHKAVPGAFPAALFVKTDKNISHPLYVCNGWDIYVFYSNAAMGGF